MMGTLIPCSTATSARSSWDLSLHRQSLVFHTIGWAISMANIVPLGWLCESLNRDCKINAKGVHCSFVLQSFFRWFEIVFIIPTNFTSATSSRFHLYTWNNTYNYVLHNYVHDITRSRSTWGNHVKGRITIVVARSRGYIGWQSNPLPSSPTLL